MSRPAAPGPVPSGSGARSGAATKATKSQALERWAADVRLGRMLAELDAIHGPVPAEVQAEVDKAWRNL